MDAGAAHAFATRPPPAGRRPLTPAVTFWTNRVYGLACQALQAKDPRMRAMHERQIAEANAREMWRRRREVAERLREAEDLLAHGRQAGWTPRAVSAHEKRVLELRTQLRRIDWTLHRIGERIVRLLALEAGEG